MEKGSPMSCREEVQKTVARTVVGPLRIKERNWNSRDRRPAAPGGRRLLHKRDLIGLIPRLFDDHLQPAFII